MSRPDSNPRATGRIDTPRQALAFVKKHGVVALVRAGALPSFVEAVAGVPVRGSWWGHPR